jgi:agmatine deiminase
MDTPLRIFPAEWAPQSGVQFTFPHEDSDWAPMLNDVIPCFANIINTVTRFEKAVVVCKDASKTAEYLKNAVQENLILIEVPSNDTWARDHSAITILEDGEPILLDFFFNGWGLKFPAFHDNLITGRLYEKGLYGEISCHVPGLAIEGGALESDGEGTLLTTAECLLSPNRNPHLDKEVTEDVLKHYLGVDRILWLHHGYLAGDDTDSHIDTLARFCDPQTIAYVQCNDPNDEHYEALKAMETELKSFTQKDGSPYNLVALPMADACFDDEGQRLPATYANFLIINDAVLVPTYGVSQDDAALQILQTCFPDREIIGINCRTLIEQHGSLHCVTMQFPKEVELNVS